MVALKSRSLTLFPATSRPVGSVEPKTCGRTPPPARTVYGDEVSEIHPIRDTIRSFQFMQRLKRAA